VEAGAVSIDEGERERSPPLFHVIGHTSPYFHSLAPAIQLTSGSFKCGVMNFSNRMGYPCLPYLLGCREYRLFVTDTKALDLSSFYATSTKISLILGYSRLVYLTIYGDPYRGEESVD
jgi:hypothetical protein